jgi:hypothetical protein
MALEVRVEQFMRNKIHGIELTCRPADYNENSTHASDTYRVSSVRPPFH